MNSSQKSAESRGLRFLRDNPESLQYLFDTIICGILTIDSKGCVNFSNNSARRMLRMERDELIGCSTDKLAEVLLDSDGSPFPKEDFPLSRVLTTGEPVRNTICSVGKDKDLLFLSLNVAPLRDRQGRIGGAAADFVDITQRTRFQQDRERLLSAVQEREECYRLLTEAAPIGIFESDTEGKWLYVNPQWVAISGLTENESHGLGWLNAIDPSDRENILLSWRASARASGIWNHETRVLHRTGRTAWIRMLAKKVPPALSESGRHVGIVEDITAAREISLTLERAKEAAEEASAAKSRFLSVVSHEIRTPMTVFMGMLELALTGRMDEDSRRFLETAETSAESLLALIEDILLFSELEQGALILNRQPFDLPRWVGETAAAWREEARSKGLAFHVEMAPDLPRELMGDPRKLHLVLNNLIGNAIKFSDRGTITFRVESCWNCVLAPSVQGVRFSVKDTGIGIPSKRLESLFQPFGQLDDSNTRRFGGTGLGLAISRGIIERMGGEIRVESIDGDGSIFSFAIPVN